MLFLSSSSVLYRWNGGPPSPVVSVGDNLLAVGRELGLEGLIRPFQESARLPVDDIVENLVAFIREYSGDDFPQDDTSMIVLRAKSRQVGH